MVEQEKEDEPESLEKLQTEISELKKNRTEWIDYAEALQRKVALSDKLCVKVSNTRDDLLDRLKSYKELSQKDEPEIDCNDIEGRLAALLQTGIEASPEETRDAISAFHERKELNQDGASYYTEVLVGCQEKGEEGEKKISIFEAAKEWAKLGDDDYDCDGLGLDDYDNHSNLTIRIIDAD